MTEHRLGAHHERRVLAATLGPGLTLLARPGISARPVQDQSASPRRRLWRPRYTLPCIHFAYTLHNPGKFGAVAEGVRASVSPLGGPFVPEFKND